METTTRRFLATSLPVKKKKPVIKQKRPPHHGLGETLERLRLQEYWRMMTDVENSFFFLFLVSSEWGSKPGP